MSTKEMQPDITGIASLRSKYQKSVGGGPDKHFPLWYKYVFKCHWSRKPLTVKSFSSFWISWLISNFLSSQYWLWFWLGPLFLGTRTFSEVKRMSVQKKGQISIFISCSNIRTLMFHPQMVKQYWILGGGRESFYSTFCYSNTLTDTGVCLFPPFPSLVVCAHAHVCMRFII